MGSRGEAAKLVLAAERSSDADAVIGAKSKGKARSVQSTITHALDDLRYHHLFRTLPERDRAQNLSNAGDVYGFQTMPTDEALTLANRDFQIAVARRLLLPLTCSCDSHRCPICHSEAKHVDRYLSLLAPVGRRCTQ